MGQDFKLFEILQTLFSMLTQWGQQLWNFFFYDLHNAINIVPEGTTIITILPIVGVVGVIVVILVKILL